MRESSANRNEGGKPARWEFGGTDNNNNIAVLSTCSFSRACPEDMKPWKDDDTLEILAILLFSPMSRFYFFSFILPRRQPECAPFWALYMRAQMGFSVYTQTTSAPLSPRIHKHAVRFYLGFHYMRFLVPEGVWDLLLNFPQEEVEGSEVCSNLDQNHASTTLDSILCLPGLGLGHVLFWLVRCSREWSRCLRAVNTGVWGLIWCS